MRAARSAAHLHSILELLLLHLQLSPSEYTHIRVCYIVHECFVYIIRTIQVGGQHPVGLVKFTIQLPYIDGRDTLFRLTSRCSDIQTTSRQTLLKINQLCFKYASILSNMQQSNWKNTFGKILILKDTYSVRDITCWLKETFSKTKYGVKSKNNLIKNLKSISNITLDRLNIETST